VYCILCSVYCVLLSAYSKELQQFMAPSVSISLAEISQWEHEMMNYFESSSGRKWREGNSKMSFNYLLLDPRTTKNLPARCSLLGILYYTLYSIIYYILSILLYTIYSLFYYILYTLYSINSIYYILSILLYTIYSLFYYILYTLYSILYYMLSIL